MTQAKTLWEMPVAPTAITRDPTFTPLAKRQCELAYYVESDGGDEKHSLIFDGVEAYSCNYLSARSANLITVAYGRVVDLGRTPWLSEISKRTTRYCASSKKVPPELKHLAICFDDGPDFEFICSEFRPPC